MRRRMDAGGGAPRKGAVPRCERKRRRAAIATLAALALLFAALGAVQASQGDPGGSVASADEGTGAGAAEGTAAAAATGAAAGEPSSPTVDSDAEGSGACPVDIAGIADAEEVGASAEMSMWGYALPLEVPEARRLVDARMREAGWLSSESAGSGSDEGGGAGADIAWYRVVDPDRAGYSSAIVAYTAVGEETSVVLSFG